MGEAKKRVLTNRVTKQQDTHQVALHCFVVGVVGSCIGHKEHDYSMCILNFEDLLQLLY